MENKQINEKVAPFRVGKWLPSDQIILEAWLANLAAEAEANPKPLLPVIQEFKNFIESEPEIYMFFNLMFTEVPRKPPYNQNPANGPQVRNYHQMLQMLN